MAVFDQTDLEAEGGQDGSLVVQAGSQRRVREVSHARDGETVLAGPGRHEFARLQVHGPADVELLDVERDGRVGLGERITSRHVEIGGRRFDVGEPDPLLHFYQVDSLIVVDFIIDVN